MVAGRRLRLRKANESADPDAVLSADAATWARIAEDLRGRHGVVPRRPAADPRQPPRGRGVPGRDERRRRPGQARVRHAAHARLRGDLDAVGRHRARDDRLRPRPGRHEGLVPPHGERARGRLPRRGARPTRLRRVGQADRRPVRRPLVRPLGVRRHGRAGYRARAYRRQQHGRPRGDRGGPHRPGPDRRAAAAQSGARVAPVEAVGAGDPRAPA